MQQSAFLMHIERSITMSKSKIILLCVAAFAAIFLIAVHVENTSNEDYFNILEQTPVAAGLSHSQDERSTLGELNVDDNKGKVKKIQQNRVQNKDGDLIDDVTIVTAYFNLGKFEKGGPSNIYTPKRYYQWMTIFSKIYNPLVAYIENKNESQRFSEIRSSVPKNLTIMRGIDRNNTWAFSLRPKTKAIYDQPNYPKHKPNTVNPDYSVVMHYKYEVMREVALENPYKTKYFAWVDIGLYRDIAKQSTEPFKIYLPPAMNLSQVAYAKVYNFKNKTNKEIFHHNIVWVCGCFFIAEREVMLKWTKDYMHYTEKFLNDGLANLDQQIIYAMQVNEHPSVRIQAYDYPGKFNAWFHLGHTCKAEGIKRMGTLPS